MPQYSNINQSGDARRPGEVENGGFAAPIILNELPARDIRGMTIKTHLCMPARRLPATADSTHARTACAVRVTSCLYRCIALHWNWKGSGCFSLQPNTSLGKLFLQRDLRRTGRSPGRKSILPGSELLVVYGALYSDFMDMLYGAL